LLPVVQTRTLHKQEPDLLSVRYNSFCITPIYR
jgi:hypothetical protein